MKCAGMAVRLLAASVASYPLSIEACGSAAAFSLD